jgi:hypothetical protein
MKIQQFLLVILSMTRKTHTTLALPAAMLSAILKQKQDAIALKIANNFMPVVPDTPWQALFHR